MKYIAILMTSGFFFLSFTSFSQTQTARGDKTEQDIIKAPMPEKKMTKRQYKKTFRYKYFKHHADLVDEFYERMEQVKKQRRKMEREMKKPKYSDPSYFGHSRKPKKHSPDKMKLCAECGIRH